METVVILNINLLNFEEIIVFLPTKEYCFINCVNFLTGKDYKQQNLDLIRNEKKTIKDHD